MKLYRLVSALKEKKFEATESLQKTQIQAKEILLKAQEDAIHIQTKAEENAARLTADVVEHEKKLRSKESALDSEKNWTSAEKAKLEKEKTELLQKKEEVLERLEKIAKLSGEAARDLILKGWEEKLKEEIVKKIKAAEEEVKQTLEVKSRELLMDAMRYGAVDYAAEYTLSTVSLPSEDVKGRIIGKEGRNIRTFELATGVDVDLEEEGIIKFSSFDSMRREVARVSMERLLRDGRIQPERIEEIVAKTREDMDKIIAKAGEELCHSVGLYNVPTELMSLLGRFKYRFSYGQNMILHTLEETRIGVALAHELGADVVTVKLGCLFHDIGKVITDKEGSHVTLGVDILKQYKMDQAVIDTVASHHEDVPFNSVEGVIVYIADAISGGRPGARHEDFQEYLKRIKTIEDIAKAKKGIAEAYALQAGRELRVIVRPEEVTDADAEIMANQIREEVEEKFPTFPGQVKITVIRETRAFATSHS
ncbi:ribonuclease Y [Candidatus Roizmanbacteria bacterium RIFCSPHIGHO2_02_FULL_40_13b]|uniref:Ribonuclease Y n=1 Tax=Candidatus Roizmanbacteria bacterium RIFCSPHIGHO2_01_FULL_39_24 TaxID=1802032 RepID=A0A1F7GKS4_9BACT|nr:MAG: ribonuclease Y [Candidatus Roizmanbacteria bacterium RIFCSPHIGHO2_01_FULL_39_24]OGK27992.1 MAG: ribonuclease Y [Candidatus Roizmanbacteria bacterium RIFCSPHIGHO2_02_FULL_40_13b]OGK49216.1 MAG: ribonuclease Y [Candidatus Roizmanbacteria bacterium RIFCSPLOWO2_01_FULL_40_32]OGK57188.1 MAG: ribonuclease Y [Candidatus Roizmanbacteria bacterium RIFCSPLOWO2_02_FULL_39_8]